MDRKLLKQNHFAADPRPAGRFPRTDDTTRRSRNQKRKPRPLKRRGTEEAEDRKRKPENRALEEQKPNLTMRKSREAPRESKPLTIKITKERQRKSSRLKKNLTDSSADRPRSFSR